MQMHVGNDKRWNKYTHLSVKHCTWNFFLRHVGNCMYWKLVQPQFTCTICSWGSAEHAGIAVYWNFLKYTPVQWIKCYSFVQHRTIYRNNLWVQRVTQTGRPRLREICKFWDYHIIKGLMLSLFPSFGYNIHKREIKG